MKTLVNKNFDLIEQRWGKNQSVFPRKPAWTSWTSFVIAGRADLKIMKNKPPTNQNYGGFGISISDTIERSPRLIEKIKQARASLKNETLLDYEDIFGK
jgi:hypothetical protein